jgi:anti-sigma factor RsiW
MNCFTCENNLSAYIDDELVPDVRREMEGHIGACEPCQKNFETLLASWELAGGTRTDAAPEGLWKSVESMIQEKRNARTTQEDLALMVRGLASEIRDLRQTVASLKDQADMRLQGDDVRDRTRQGLGIWTGPGVGRTRSDVG